MGKRLTPKRESELLHKVAVLSQLQLEALDELGWSSEVKITKLHEEILKAAYSAGTVSETKYFGDIVNRVDTVIRKNYEKQ